MGNHRIYVKYHWRRGSSPSVLSYLQANQNKGNHSILPALLVALTLSAEEHTKYQNDWERSSSGLLFLREKDLFIRS